jgi:hypothetical protein
MTDRRKITADNCNWREETFCRLLDLLTLAETANDRRCSELNGRGCPFAAARPRYDSARGELLFCRAVLFRLVRFRDRHAVLCAFEDHNWPPRIVDPLGRDMRSTQNGYCDIVYWLNRSQSPWLIEFSCDGSRHGIRWKLVGVVAL